MQNYVNKNTHTRSYNTTESIYMYAVFQILYMLLIINIFFFNFALQNLAGIILFGRCRDFPYCCFLLAYGMLILRRKLVGFSFFSFFFFLEQKRETLSQTHILDVTVAIRIWLIM